MTKRAKELPDEKVNRPASDQAYINTKMNDCAKAEISTDNSIHPDELKDQLRRLDLQLMYENAQEKFQNVESKTLEDAS